MKLFHAISTSILGTAVAFGVGLAITNSKNVYQEARAAGTINVTTSSAYFSAADSSYANSTTGHDANNLVTITVSKAYVTGSQVRADKGATITVQSNNTDELKSVSFTFSGTYTGGLNSSYTGLSGTSWNVTTSTSGSNARITAMTIVTKESGIPVQKYTVTYSAGTNGTGSYQHTQQPEGNYQLLPFTSLTGVSASSGYRFKDYTVGGVNKNPGDTITINSATTVTVNFEERPIESTYDLTHNWTIYAKEWGGYAPHTISGSDVDAEYEGLISFTNVSKQTIESAAIKDRPVIAAKSGVASTMSFTLDSTVSATYKITSVHVEFLQWGTKKLAVALYKGTTVSGDALDSFSASDNPRTLSTSNLNGDSFIVDFSTTNTSNVQLGITSISIDLAAKASFGTLDHIKVTSLPNTIYHVDEYFNPTGLQVTAYDGADEATASYKDVTDSIDTLIDDSYQFVDSDVPGFDVDVEYTESGKTKSTSYHLNVYAKEEYELVTSEPTDWSGNYLLVATYTDSSSVSHTVAINSALVNFDQPLNFKDVAVSDNKIITGQECEFVFEKYNSGYSMLGKNGKYAFGNASNRFVTSETPQELSLSFDSNIVTVTGGNDYFLRMNSATSGAERFGFYEKGTVDISFYKLKASDNADIYAQLFLDTLSTGSEAICQYNPASQVVSTDLAALKAAWKSLASDYDEALTHSEQEQFRLGAPSTDVDATNIAKALALYDHIVRAYGTQLNSEGFANYNFMNRSISPLSGQINIISSINSSTTITVVIIVSVISVSTVCAFFLLRKYRKHN